MSDLEDKLRSLEFRELPQELRRTVLSAAQPVHTWRDWLWPSPLAWATVAVIWLIALATAEPASPGKHPQPVAKNTQSPLILKAAEIERILSER